MKILCSHASHMLGRHLYIIYQLACTARPISPCDYSLSRSEYLPNAQPVLQAAFDDGLGARPTLLVPRQPSPDHGAGPECPGCLVCLLCTSPFDLPQTRSPLSALSWSRPQLSAFSVALQDVRSFDRLHFGPLAFRIGTLLTATCPFCRLGEWHDKYGPILQLNIGRWNLFVVGRDRTLIRELFIKRGAIYSSRPQRVLPQIIETSDGPMYVLQSPRYLHIRVAFLRTLWSLRIIPFCCRVPLANLVSMVYALGHL
jgi:hypothetical protein